MRALKPPEQMGMLMSAASAFSDQGCHGERKAQDGPWGCGGTGVIRWVGEHCFISAGDVLITGCVRQELVSHKVFPEVWGWMLRCQPLLQVTSFTDWGGKARFSSGWDPVCHLCQPEIRWLQFAQPRAMFWDSLEVYLEPGCCCLLNRCFSCKQCRHIPTAKLATKLAAEQI